MVRFTGPRDSERPYGDRDATDSRRPSPPPNYLRRSNQWRLLVLVASLMLVLVLIEEARKPKYYRWMWGQTQESPSDPVVSPRTWNRASKAVSSETTLPLGARDAWSYAVDQLTLEERTGLRRLLRGTRTGQPLPEDKTHAATSAISRLEQSWAIYLEHVRQSTTPSEASTDASPQSPSLLDQGPESAASPRDMIPLAAAPSPRVLREKLEKYWDEEGHSVLERLVERIKRPSEVESEEGRRLAPLQQALDDEAQSHIRDNARFGSAESEAWFRFIERLREGDVDPVASGSEYVTYLQLLDQPDVYRGRWVRVRGEVRRGYRVEAPENDSGVQHYYVLWLKPEDGTNAPITLFALSLPPGFPSLADKSATGTMTHLNETVDAGGVFFKRWAYRGERSLEIAPLVIASEVAWFREVAEMEVPVSRNDVMTAILGGVLLGLGGLWFAWRTLAQATSKVSVRRWQSRESRDRGTGGYKSRGRSLIVIGILCGIPPLCGFPAPGNAQISVEHERSSSSPSESRELPWTRPDRPSVTSQLPDVLQLYGLISSDLETLVAESTSSDQRERLLLNLLYHLPRLTPADWHRWRPHEPSVTDVLEEPSKYRGQAITLRGRVTEVLARPVPPEFTETLEFSRYWQVSVQLTDGEGNRWGHAKVFSRQIPESWHRGERETLDEATEFSAAFLDASRDPQDQVFLVAAAAGFRWFPDRLATKSGEAGTAMHPIALVLANAGVDHALWDEVRRRNGRPLDGPDRELFYQILAAMQKWDSVAMGQQQGQPLELGALLLDPTQFQGQLLKLTAFARRITRVVVEDADILQRFGIDHYFQIDALITLENQQIRLESRTPGRSAVYSDKFPMTFCVTTIPTDLMELVEEDAGVSSARPLINERMDVSGIFLKTWPFRSEFLLGVDPDQRHPSPLLLGTRPVLAPLPPVPRDTPLELFLATLFVLILLGGAVWVWKREARGRRRAVSKGT